MSKKISFDKSKITPVVSEIIDRVIPSHIQSNYPKFIEFVQVFFSFLEEGNKSGLYLNSIPEQKSNLSEDSQFLSLIEKEIGLFVPQKYVADPAIFYNRIVDLWKSKGSEESIRTFFRLFLDKEVDFYYPWSNVLITSDGRWIRDHKIRVLSKIGFGNPLDLEGKSIFQVNSGATARVERVELKTYGKTLKIYEVTLIKETITGTFSSNNDITSLDNLITATVRETVNGIKIIEGGSGYLPGDRIYLPRLNQRTILAFVKEVSPEGSIKSIRIENYGALLTSDNPISLSIKSKNGQGAILELLFGALVIEDGYYQGTSGQLSESNVLQDSEYYQKFSYEVIVNSPINIWKDIFRKSIHPSGLKVFSNFLIDKEIDQKIKKTTDLLTKEIPRETNFIESLSIQSDISILKQDYVTRRANGEINRNDGLYFKEDYIGESIFLREDSEGVNSFKTDYLETGLFTCKWDELFSIKSESKIDNKKIDLNLEVKKVPSVKIEKTLESFIVDIDSFAKDVILENPDIQIFESLPIETKSFLSAQDYVNNYDRLNSYFVNPFEDKDYFNEIYLRDDERYASNMDGTYLGSQIESNIFAGGFESLHDDIVQNSKDDISKSIENKVNIIASKRFKAIRHQRDIESKIKSVSPIQSILSAKSIHNIDIKSDINNEINTIIPRSIHNTDIKSKVHSQVNVNIEPIYSLFDKVESSIEVSFFGQDYTNEFTTLGKFYQEENYFLEEYSTDRQKHYFPDPREGYSFNESDVYVGYKYHLTKLIQEESFLETRKDIVLTSTMVTLNDELFLTSDNDLFLVQEEPFL